MSQAYFGILDLLPLPRERTIFEAYPGVPQVVFFRSQLLECLHNYIIYFKKHYLPFVYFYIFKLCLLLFLIKIIVNYLYLNIEYYKFEI